MSDASAAAGAQGSDLEHVAADGFLACIAAGQQVGLPLTAVAAVIRPGALTPLPLAPRAVLGLLNWQGNALPVFALGQLLAPGSSTDLHVRTARIVILSQPSRFGLWVESVMGAGHKGWSLTALADLLRSSVVLPPSQPQHTPLAAPLAVGQRRDEQDLLVFSVNAENYALPLAEIDHVARQLTPALLALPQLSLREHWQYAPGATQEWLAVQAQGERLLLAADRLGSILRVPAQALRKVPALLSAQRSEMNEVAAIYTDADHAQVTVLDLPKLLEHARFNAGVPQTETEDASMTLRQALYEVLVLRMGQHRFALAISASEAVVRLPAALQPVPGAPDYVRGMLQWRGQSVPVLDYRALLNHGTAAPLPTSARVLLLNIGGVLSGLLVDEMRDLFTLYADQLVPAPALHPLQAQLITQLITRENEAQMLPLLEPAALGALDQHGALAALAATAEPA